MTTTPSHIVVLTLENEDFSSIVGDPTAPYLNSLIAQGMLFTDFSGESHPSQPNYLALFSGSTRGVTTNGPIPQFPASVPTLASALAAKGYTFGGYAETSAVPERQPWIHFANSVADAYNFSAFPQTAAGFANLPTVSFVTPNDAHNLTPLSDNGGGVAVGDAWVQANISAYAAWAQANNSLLIITFDENNTNPAVTLPNHITTIVVGAGVPAGVTNDSLANHYSLLNTIEGFYGLTPIGVSPGAPALDFYSATTAKAASTITERFSGISDPNNTPPQNALAAGPNCIFEVESSRYMVTDLNGNTIIPDSSLWSMFSGLDNTPAGFNPTLDNSLLDARAAYDSSTGCYAVIADNFQPGTGNFGTNIVIAVSVDSNPADGWHLASIDTSNGFTTQSDMPYLSVSNGNICITTPEYLDAGGGYNTAEFIVGESSVIAAGNAAIAPNASNIASGSNGIMRNVAGANGKTYYLSAFSNHTRTILAFQTYDATTGSFSAPIRLGLDDSDVGGGGSDYTAAQLGTTKLLNINDSRIQGLAYASSGGHDYVYGVSEVRPSAGAIPEIEWFKLDVTDPANPQIVMGDVISGASIGSGVAVFNPSIAIDQNGDVLINFSASGPNMYPADYYTVLGAGLSAFSAPTLYQASDTFFDSGSPSGSTNMRWGTYSSAIADPNNPNGFWISNEYVTKTGVTIPTGLTSWWSTVTAQVTVSSSSPPSLGGAGVTATYTEGGAAATLDSGLTVSDPSSSTLSGATVTIASGLFAGDTLNFTNQSGIAGSYNSATGALTLTGSASLAAYHVALDSVTFSSSSLNPTNYGTDLTRAINWRVSAGSLQSAVVSSSVNVVGVDQAPVLSGAGNTATYTTGGAAVAIDNALAVGDPDNLQLASATVTISGNFQTGDTLSFTNQNGIVGSYSSATGVLALTGTATLAQYQAALDAVTFSTTSASAASRTISWQVNDGTLKSAAATSTVNVTGNVTVPPTLGGAGNTVSYTEGGAAATVDAGLTVSDPSSSTLSGATVSIANGFLGGDALNFANQNGISGSYNASTGVLTLTGTASLAAYQTALESVSFSSTNLNPTNYGADLTRTINWQVSAGAAQSAVVSTSLSVVGVDQAPTLSGAGNTTTYAPGGAAVVIDNALAVSDPDNLQLASATVTISGNFQAGDTLSFTNQNGIAGSYSSATGVLTLTGTATLAQYQAALDAVTFSTTSASAASRTITWQVSDGTLKSAAATSTVAVGSQLAAPTFTSPTNGQTVTTGKPTITGTGAAGDTVTLSEGATVLSSSIVVQSTGGWSYTPTAPFANGALTLTATQAVAGGPSSAAATDSFTVNATGGLTISTAQTGNVNLAAANNPLTITSTGSVTTSSGDAIDGKSGTAWNIIDFGKISGVVGSSSAGIYSQGAGTTVQNFGNISGATAGVWLSSGGNVTNFSGGAISATGNYGVYIGGGAGTVINAGTITGPQYAVDFATSSSANRLIVDPGATFNGAVNGNGGSLELSGGTGSIGSIGSSSFSGFNQLIADAGGSWTLTGSNSIANIQDNGNLVIAGSLKISTAVNPAGAGQFGILSGGTLEVASDQATNSQIDFLGAGQLTIDNAALFGVNVGTTTYSGPLIEGFAAGDIIDIHGLSPTAAQLLYSPTNGMLQITNGSGQVATMDFQNSTLGTGTFSFASDGSSGLKIMHS